MNYFDLSSIDHSRHIKVRDHLLWEFDLKKFDYSSGKSIVVERVVQRGNMDDWLTIFNLYGSDGVREEIKNIPFLSDKDLNFVHVIFEIPIHEMKCYAKKLSPNQHWTS
jgi:hypothetical protein